MGRRFPALNGPLTHPVISFPFIVACVAATIAIITALCGVRFRRKTASPSETTEKPVVPSTITTPPLPTTIPSPPQASPTEETEDTTENKHQEIKELPLPPARQLRETYSCNNYATRTMSKREYSSSFSVKISRSLSMAKHRDQKEEENGRKQGKFKSEDSIWTKTIILGEKCKVPDEDDAIIYDNKGKRITAYHPKAPSSISLSRTNSCIDPDAIPIPSQEKEKVKLRVETEQRYLDVSSGVR